MCGFSGCFSLTDHSSHGRLNLVDNIIEHRGPDFKKLYQDQYFKTFFHRLKIIGDEKNNQPIISQNKRYVMVFNGEIYNFLELAKLVNYKVESTTGDTEVLLELFSKFNFEYILKKLHGMYAIVLYDKKIKKIFLARDKFGTKPLYYHIRKNTIFFCSEIKGIPFKKQFNFKIVNDYLDYGVYPNNQTFFQNINNVPASHYVEFDKRKKVIKYYDLEKEAHKNNKYNFSSEEFENILGNSLSIRLNSLRNINFHLSGGIDSTALLIKSAELWNKEYKLNTVSYSYDGYPGDEYKFISNTCKKLNINNTKIFISSKEIPDLAEKLQFFEDEPYGGIAAIAEYKLNYMQRLNGNIVSVEGMGGDELLGGYNSHYYLAIRDLYISKKNPELLNNMIKKSKKSLKHILLITDQFINSNFNGNTDLSQIRKKPRKFIKENLNYNKIFLKEIFDGSLTRTLRFRDRSSAACGRELRFPLLDHKLVEYCLIMPFEKKFKDGYTKSPLREIVKIFFKKKSIDLKRSNNSAQSYWLKKDLKIWALDHINQLKNKKIIEDRYFKNINNFFSKDSKNTFYLWQLINLNIFFNNNEVNNLRFYD